MLLYCKLHIPLLLLGIITILCYFQTTVLRDECSNGSEREQGGGHTAGPGDGQHGAVSRQVQYAGAEVRG